MSTEPPDPAVAAYLEERSFWIALQGIRPHATYAIGALALLMFALETLWGGSESNWTLWRMGAHSRPDVWAGEVWRLLSSAFLHIGFPHVALNLWCLWVLGPFVEKLLGSPRFVVLYALSALSGGLASLAFGHAGLSAGASGAIWGLMAATFAFGLKPRGLLPAGVAQRARSLGFRTLLLNAVISMLPRIDAYAHFGGGLAGGALVLSGISTRGLLRPDQPGSAAARYGSPATRGAAALLSLLMFGSLLAALARGRPWDLQHPPASWRSTPLPGAGIAVDVPPVMLLQILEAEPGTRGFVVGEPDHDPIMARIFVKPLKGGSKGWSEREAMELVRQSLELEALPEGWTRTDAVAVLDVDGRPMAVESLRFPRGATSKIWVRLCGANVVRVEVVTADRTPSTWVAARDRFVRSLRPEAAP